MFWTFVATVFAGLGAAGIALGIRSITGKRAPKWLIPVFAGLGMLGYLVHGEYTWFEHKTSQLPPEALVVGQEQLKNPLRPWTYVVPQVTGFTVIDTNSIETSPNDRDVHMFYLYRFEQSYTDAVSKQVHLLNCATQELIPLDNEGNPQVEQLRKLADDDRLFIAACF
ncbi:hypothetical protein [Marinobacter zhejiangensis]|uniref:Uncharacterized protein n=1 Tax=Marinobacter zhejiangensis TaxID=488535 RepID=A0A1I4R972_9GAMM|nr:hypothetical protein [Marinobacter zhejiangensis]SFM48725.1 hypothetical protein SAMN04487963_2622 [Marinobacter zhejiangensis]